MGRLWQRPPRTVLPQQQGQQRPASSCSCSPADAPPTRNRKGRHRLHPGFLAASGRTARPRFFSASAPPAPKPPTADMVEIELKGRMGRGLDGMSFLPRAV
jgi:hypothetical protein